MKFFERAVLFLATGFFIGYVPFAPGTFGTLLGMPLCYLITRLGVGLALTGVVLFIFLAIWLASKAEKISKQTDPAHIVIDEIAGVQVAFIGLPLNLATALCGFALFRAFDIIKPFPIRLLERKIRGGSGIVFDDIMAGIYANLVLRLVLVMFPIMA